MRPVVLIIMDGWGVAPPGEGNAITQAHLPVWQRLLANYPVVTLHASGQEVGLVWGQVGNSEVGHLNIGAGRVYYQTLSRLNKEIESGNFFKNTVFLKAAEQVKKNKSSLHLIGLLGPGNVHASQAHLQALLEFCQAQKIKKVFIHGILDGRDALFNGGLEALKQLQEKIKETGVGEVASLAGRFYAMDRDNRWDRVVKAYAAIVEGKGETASDPLAALQASYDKKVYDEEFVPTVITGAGEPLATIKPEDAVIFFNFRPDRARELTQALVLPSFDKFPRSYLPGLLMATLTEYEKNLPVEVAYPTEFVKNCLAEVISAAGFKQIHLAETEKYAHVTYFLNGLREEPFPGEERLLVPSPKVGSYDQAPAMSTSEITKQALQVIESKKYDLVVINFANADMVGHTGNTSAVIKGVEIIDKAIGQITDLVTALGGATVITADHGNAEEVVNLQTGEIDKEHSTNPVPLVLVAKQWQGQKGLGGDVVEGDLSLVSEVGILADVAPTVLKIMGLPPPPEMTGRPLI